nr:class I SAM-dependent methyltransferase [uncultured Actinoplanes sp.]
MTVDYDAELARYNPLLHRAWAVQPHDRVLDIGCGAGQTTRRAARSAPAGSAVGIDVSEAAIARAEPLPNVGFVCGDAQTYAFDPGGFDLAISRFGTMFFGDPVAAFANIARALRPGGRLVMLVWQAADRNEWYVAIHRALGSRADAGPDPFTLADPGVIETVLGAAGFADITVTDVAEPLYYGPDPGAALDWVRGFTSVSTLLSHQDPTAAAATLDRLRDVFAAHQTGDGVWFDSRAWLVTARRPVAEGP